MIDSQTDSPMTILINIAGALGIAFATAFLRTISIAMTTRNNRNAVVDIRSDVVRGGVEAVWQLEAKHLKHGTDGKLSEEQKESLRQKCRMYVAEWLSDRNQTIAEVFGSEEVLDGYINLEVNRRKGHLIVLE